MFKGVKELEQAVKELKPRESDPNVTELRSGKKINKKMSTEASAPSGSSGAAQEAAPKQSLKLVQTPNLLKKYNGKDTNYSAKQFIESCEHSMRYAGVTSGDERISYVLAHIEPSSEVYQHINNFSFAKVIREDDYEGFKVRFLDLFYHRGGASSVKRINTLVNKIAVNINQHSLHPSLPVTTELSNLALDLLEENGWFEGDKISKDRLYDYFTLFHCLLVLKPSQRNVALSVDFKPKDDMHDFICKLDTKISEKEQEPINQMKTVSAVSQSVSSTKEKPVGRVSNTTPQDPRMCFNCRQVGHIAVKCPTKPQDRGKSANPKYYQNSGYKPVNRSGPPKEHRTQNKYCCFHESDTHNTEECRWILQNKRKPFRKPDAGTNSMGSPVSQNFNKEEEKKKPLGEEKVASRNNPG